MLANDDNCLKERNADGDWIGPDGSVVSSKAAARKIHADTTCDNFIHSLKEHFEGGDGTAFKNPWNTNWDPIVLDTYWTGAHRKGQIQLVCYVNKPSASDGAGCPLSRARFYIQATMKTAVDLHIIKIQMVLIMAMILMEIAMEQLIIV